MREQLTLIVPLILLFADALFMLGYTNRFISYIQFVQMQKERYLKCPSDVTSAQIKKMKRRLRLSRFMLAFVAVSIACCVATIVLIYFCCEMAAMYTMGCSLAFLLISLFVAMRETQISVQVLKMQLSEMEK